MDYLKLVIEQMGIPAGFIWIFIIIIIWSVIWKMLALWKAARKGSVVWFIGMALFNTVGILEILYIFVFSKMKCCKAEKPKARKKRRRKK